MADRSGIASQLGLKAEATYGTAVTVDRFLEFVSEGLKLDVARNESKGLRSGQRLARFDHWAAGKRQAGGQIEFEVANKGFGLLLTTMSLGAVTTTADGLGWRHRGTLGDLFGDSMTVQVGRPDVSGTVQPFTYSGCKVADWELSQAIDDFLSLKLTLDARDETTATALATATAPTVTELFHWGGLSVTVAGSAFDVTSLKIAGNNGLKADRHFLRGSTLKKEPIEEKLREITFELDGEFESLAAYNRYVNGTDTQIVATWTAVATYDTAKPFKLVVTMEGTRWDGETPTVDGPGVLSQPMKGVVLDDGVSPTFAIDYFTSDATP